ncbi:aminotransferase class I/II-fold pyridoxal phosphate-dependent enzyme [Streptomyces albus subsp. chlorinus]|uniref:aminotransferase class I/II-fold pyridoxal phosphate-dependent enzyme n=1 Tax=Streptomyces albus TaxID=1888 RepID=UPI0015704B57|nr:aminotransferase class I/II-fold pyridoxal phosphate-dependent enzyme [Streptomyces albus]NSC20061.1 aminotransferase class I/II-fold pyridoxal phosphate-dependent enzyme [Streptomyces albus subsp. chlorinus]
MRRSADIDALQHALCAALGSRAPVCTLARLGQDTGALAALDPAVLDRPTLVHGGAPYGPSSPAPAPHALNALLRRAETLHAPQVLVPHVRRTDDTGPLRAAGFVPLATAPECVVRLTGEVDDVLRARVGPARLRDLRRRHHAVSRDLTWERIRLSRLDAKPWARDAFVELHRRRAEHHGGGHNPYTADALDALASGVLADRTEMFVRRRGNAVVQAGLVTVAHNGRGLYHLTQAVDHDDPAAGRNLYVASLYRLYLDARHSGLRWVHLGRGDAERKRRLGADLFVPLDHWLRAPGLGPAPNREAEPALSRFAAPPVTAVPVPGPARFRHRPRFDTVDLSGNTNPFLEPESQYPHLDTAELARTYLAAVSKVPGHNDLTGLSADHLLFSSGAVDGVMLLLAALASPGERVCVTPPTFELYAHFARVLRLPVVEVPLRGDDLSRLDSERILAADPRVTLLCDPNNPVGTRLDRDQVRTLVTRTRGVVVIDEAYVEFSGSPSYAGLVAEHDNLIVLRTLSKAWGLAAARCGVALAQPGLVDALRRVQVPFGFTDASQHAVRDRLTNSRRALASMRLIRAERDRMAAALAHHPAVDRVFPSEANFLLVRLRKHERVMEHLRGAGIVVADTARLLPATCRISVGDRRANNALLEALSFAL